jgi:hypothetical protein
MAERNVFTYWLGRMVAAPAGSALLLALAVAGFIGFRTYDRHLQDVSDQQEKARQSVQAVQREAIVAKQRAALKHRCTANIDQIVTATRNALKDDQPSVAAALINECEEWISAGTALKARVDANAAVQAKAAAQAAAWQAQLRAAEKADLAERKRSGVHIGMSQDEVIKSSWGKPRKINRTTRAAGTDEQWVYSGGYLYFTDGVLRTVQN